MEKNPLSMQLKLNPEDFLPASNEEKESLVIMRESVSFWKDGLRRLLKVTGWQPEETLFIGDDQNDLPAVKYFHGYTVETAEPFMKEAATKVYSSVGDMLLAHL